MSSSQSRRNWLAAGGTVAALSLVTFFLRRKFQSRNKSTARSYHRTTPWPEPVEEEIPDALREEFLKAARFVADADMDLPDQILLTFYAHFKQAMNGQCNTPQPSAIDFTKKAKWSAWQSIGSQTRVESMRRYVEMLCKIVPSWREGVGAFYDDKPTLPKSAEQSSSSKRMSMGPVISTMARNEDEPPSIPDSEKTVWQLAGENNIERVTQLLDSTSEDDVLNGQDGEGMSPLYWAVDRGQIDMARFLIQRGANVEIADECGETPLHIAVICEHEEIVSVLLDAGARSDTKNNEGHTPAQLSRESPAICNLFREQL